MGEQVTRVECGVNLARTDALMAGDVKTITRLTVADVGADRINASLLASTADAFVKGTLVYVWCRNNYETNYFHNS